MSATEVTTVGILAVIAAFVLVRAGRGAPRMHRIALGVVVFASLVAASRLVPTQPPLPATAQPKFTTRGEYLSSDACRSCHPSEHSSWHRSYHRTMTQNALITNVRAPLDGRTLDLDGRTHRLLQRGSEVWALLPDPDEIATAALERRLPENAPDVERRVVLLTGSHHEQTYWVTGRRSGELRLFPFVWMIAEERFIPRRDAFLQPPDAPTGPLRWNSNCIGCHAVGGRPGHDVESDAFNTKVVEFGIACEACHGPAGAHVQRYRDPIERYAKTSKHGEDPTIKNPAHLDPVASAAVCGQCHSYAFPRDEDEWWTQGYTLSYRPGQTIEHSRTLFSLAHSNDPSAPRIEAAEDSLFWGDGAIRVGGREYNALVESPCYQRGHGERRMTCLSCHSMHEGDPNDQLSPKRSVDDACVSCHQAQAGSAHSHHTEGSTGSSCVNCHMPPTTYALFKAIRSHRIDSPNVRLSQLAGRPNACNLCHLQRSLGWTRDYLQSWYGVPKVALDPDAMLLAASATDALRGNAAVRVISAAALGWTPALDASPRAYPVPLLAELLVDPYSAVRFVAGRSLRAQPGYADIDYDFLASPSTRELVRQTVHTRFRAAKPLPDGVLDETTVRALVAARDTRAITIAE
jgi:Cytochrome c552/Cytochrome c554 and c-prime